METMFHAMSVFKWHIKMSEKMTVLCFMYFLYSMIGSPTEARLVLCSQKSHFHPLHLLHNSSFFSISVYISAQSHFLKWSSLCWSCTIDFVLCSRFSLDASSCLCIHHYVICVCVLKFRFSQ